MDWQDRGIVLHVRPHGESSAIVEVLSAAHGRHAGLVRGAKSKRMRGVLQPGNLIEVHWRARLSEHLGAFVLELVEARAAVIFDDALALDGLGAACAMACLCLPERERFAGIYAAFEVLTSCMHERALWPALYVRWEAGILRELGYGLQLERCAATGQSDHLTHVSPRTGRAVSAAAAQPYVDKLLTLPAFLHDGAAPLQDGDIGAGLTLTGYFLERRLLWPLNRTLPDARARMTERLLDAGLL